MRKALEAYFSNDTSLFTLLARARNVDSNYATPYVFTAFAGAYRRRFAIADSALRHLDDIRDRLTPAEAAMTDHVHALMRPDLDSALRAAQTFVRLQPGSMEAPLLLASTGITARQPRITLDALKLVDPDRGLNLAGGFYWIYMSAANAELGDRRQALNYIEEARRRFPTSGTLLTTHLAELAREGRVEDAEHQVDAFRFPRPLGRLRNLRVIAAISRHEGRTADAERIVTRGLRDLDALHDTSRAGIVARWDLATASGERWQLVADAADSLLPRVQPIEAGFRADLLSSKAVALVHLGRVAEAQRIDSVLSGNRPQYDFGWSYVRPGAHRGAHGTCR
jgi:hypothetical protein